MLIPHYFREEQDTQVSNSRSGFGWLSLTILILTIPWIWVVTVVDIFMIGGGPNGFSPVHAIIHAILLFLPIPAGIACGWYGVRSLRRPHHTPAAIGLYGQLLFAAFLIVGGIISALLHLHVL